MAARLRGPDTRVETVRGGLGELRVSVDGKDAYNGNRLWYASPKSVVTAVRTWLAGQADPR